jgi:hypothetical protein
MKKILAVSVVLMVTLIGFSVGLLDDYIYNFDYFNYSLYDSHEMVVLNRTVSYLKTGVPEIRNTDLSLLSLNEAEKKGFELLLSLLSAEIIRPYNEFKVLMKEYPESIFLKAMFVEFAYSNWMIIFSKGIYDEINVVLDEIESIKGENPFVFYFRALLNSKSRLYFDAQKAQLNYDNILNKFPPNQRIYEDCFEFYYKQNETAKIANLYETYISFPRHSITNLFIFMEIFHAEGKRDISEYLAERLILITDFSFFKAKAYELLGDNEEDIESKINYYMEAYRHVPTTFDRHYHNQLYPYSKLSSIHLKLAKTAYDYDSQKYENFVRLVLNQAESINPNNEEINLMLKQLRRKVQLGVFLKFFVPIIIFVTIGILLILRWEYKLKMRDKHPKNHK